MNLAYPTYRCFVPQQAVGASLVYFDIFNPATSGLELLVSSVVPIVSGDVAVTSTLAVDLYLTYTTAVGTGGTAATYNGTALDAMTFTTLTSKGGDLDGRIVGGLTRTGGATAGAVISWCSVFTEETNAGAYLGHTNDLARRNNSDNPCVIVTGGNGIRVVQGSVASAGNIGFDVIFAVRPK
jgi:hypothetical protein